MLTLQSSAFEDGGVIPRQYSCEGVGESPPLAWGGTPAGAKSLVLIADDPDVPKALLPSGVYDHWVIYDIPPSAAGVPEGGPAPGVEGRNGSGRAGWASPCPPSQYEPQEHRYVFVLWALDTELYLPPGASKGEVLAAMQGHVLEQAQLVGRYRKQGN